MTASSIPEGQDCFQAALYYFDLGWAPVACCPPDHQGVSEEHKGRCQSPGKRPWHPWKDYQEVRPTQEDIYYWWKKVPTSNVGITYGVVSGLIGIDIDGSAGETLLKEKSKGNLPDTLEFTTPGGGRRLLYAVAAGTNLRTTCLTPLKGEELRFQAQGAQTVMPPSRHPNGGVYAWVPGHSPVEIKAAPAPAWLLKELAPQSEAGKRKSKQEWETILGGVPEHSGRNTNATSAVGKLLGTVKDVNDSSTLWVIWLFMKAMNELNEPAMEEDELRTAFTSIQRKEATKRQKEELAQLDTYVERSINNGSPEQPDKEEKNPLWHLIIVGDNPPDFLLRSQFWHESPRLRDGYLALDAEQIFSWKPGKGGIPFAAWTQAQIVVPPALKSWSTPNGHLDRLLASAQRIDAAPESQRDLFILGFVYQYLQVAREPPSNGDAPVLSIHGSPTRLEDGAVVFKLKNLKRKIKDAKEDFAHREVTRLLERQGFSQCCLANSRWWKASKEAISQIGSLTREDGGQ